MIETKFRAWDVDNNEMFVVDSMTFRENGNVFRVWKHGTEGKAGLLINPASGFLMQYTGLKDINGVDIFDGDIIKDEYNRILLVERWKCRFMFRALTETNFIRADIIQWFEGDTASPMIVGNIYENPELMESEYKS